MKICDLLSVKSVCADLSGTSKNEIIEELINLLIISGSIEKKDKKR